MPQPDKPPQLGKLLRRWLPLLVAFAYTAAMYFLSVGCPVRYVTGVPCPGCGMGRAAVAALSLDFAKAFSCHPLFWLVPPVLWLALSKRGQGLSARLRNTLLLAAAVLFFAVYIVRLAFDWIP